MSKPSRWLFTIGTKYKLYFFIYLVVVKHDIFPQADHHVIAQVADSLGMTFSEGLDGRTQVPAQASVQRTGLDVTVRGGEFNA